jgi:hypothetical protein
MRAPVTYRRIVASRCPRVAVSLIATLLLALMGCQKPPEPLAAPRTVAELYQRFDDAMVRTGQVLHLVTTVAAETGPLGNEGREESWVDAAHSMARIEVNGGSRGTRLLLYVDDTRYYKDWDGRRGSEDRDHCYGAGVASVAVLSCAPESDPPMSERVNRAAYQDRSAIVIERVWKYPNAPTGDWLLTSRTYLDPATFLPFVSENVGTAVDGGGRVAYGRLDYDVVEFVSLDGLPARFFQPQAIGVAPVRRPTPGLRRG